jgi:hypothetical protein
MKTLATFGNLYVGNKMTGIPYFNVPWFNETAEKLRRVPGTGQIFNPAEWDVLRGFDPMQCPNGTLEEAVPAGFVLRDALGADWEWIAKYSNGLVIGPNWSTSKGTISEIACHQALGLPVWEAEVFFQGIHFGSAADLFTQEWQFPPLGIYLA